MRSLYEEQMYLVCVKSVCSHLVVFPSSHQLQEGRIHFYLHPNARYSLSRSNLYPCAGGVSATFLACYSYSKKTLAAGVHRSCTEPVVTTGAEAVVVAGERALGSTHRLALKRSSGCPRFSERNTNSLKLPLNQSTHLRTDFAQSGPG